MDEHETQRVDVSFNEHVKAWHRYNLDVMIDSMNIIWNLNWN